MEFHKYCLKHPITINTARNIKKLLKNITFLTPQARHLMDKPFLASLQSLNKITTNTLLLQEFSKENENDSITELKHLIQNLQNLSMQIDKKNVREEKELNIDIDSMIVNIFFIKNRESNNIDFALTQDSDTGEYLTIDDFKDFSQEDYIIIISDLKKKYLQLVQF
jgi:hypothetical protein